MKHLASKFLFLLLMVTSQIKSMDKNTEGWGVIDEITLLDVTANLLASIPGPHPDLRDAQAIHSWVRGYRNARNQNFFIKAPKTVITKILKRIHQLTKKYSLMYFDENSFLFYPNSDWQDPAIPVFEQDINFCSGSSSTSSALHDDDDWDDGKNIPFTQKKSSSNISNPLLKLAQNRLMIAGGGVVAAAAVVWYWFYYQHEPKAPAEDNNTDGDNQPEIIEYTK